MHTGFFIIDIPPFSPNANSSQKGGIFFVTLFLFTLI